MLRLAVLIICTSLFSCGGGQPANSISGPQKSEFTAANGDLKMRLQPGWSNAADSGGNYVFTDSVSGGRLSITCSKTGKDSGDSLTKVMTKAYDAHANLKPLRGAINDFDLLVYEEHGSGNERISWILAKPGVIMYCTFLPSDTVKSSLVTAKADLLEMIRSIETGKH